MSEVQKIKNELIVARKAKNKTALNVCKLLLSDIEYKERQEGESHTDAQVIQMVRKFVSNNELTISHSQNKDEINKLELENEFCKTLLGVELSEDELTEIIAKLNPANIGEGMQFLSKNHQGKFNGGLASKVVKKHLGM